MPFVIEKKYRTKTIYLYRNYEPTNCRFVDKYTQANNMSCNHKIEYKGETKNMAEWAKIFNINYDVLRCRLRRGWSVEKALTTKLSRKGK